MNAYDPKEVLYHASYETTSGLVYSQTTAWKYHQYWPEEPEEFCKEFAEMLCMRYRGIVSVEITALNVGIPVTKSSLDMVLQTDMCATASPLKDCIIFQKKYTPDDFARKEVK